MRSGAEALAWAVEQAAWEHAMCLNFVWNAYGAPKSIPSGGYPDANSNWNQSTHIHPGDRNVPAGGMAQFTGSDGHICLGTGHGDQLYSTDVAGYGLNGFTTIGAIERAWGRTYLGWTEDICGNRASFAGASSTGITPLQLQGDESMPRIIRIKRKGVGEHLMYVGQGRVSITVELSTAKAEDRDWQERVASAIASASGQGSDIPLIDDTPNGGWFIRNQFLYQEMGMPADFALSPTTPYVMPTAAAVKLSDADLAKIGAGIRPVDLTPLAQQLSSIAKDLGDDEGKILAAIDAAKTSIPGATLDLEAARLKS